jgi:hypothetical protein
MAVAKTPQLVFYASFDEPAQSPTGSKAFPALGGSAIVLGELTVFNSVFPTPDNGVVEISPNPGPDMASLNCEFNVPAIQEKTQVSFYLTLLGDPSDLVVRFEDSGDTGVLDMEFEPGGKVVVNGQQFPLPLLPGETDIYVKLTFETESGSPNWVLYMAGPSGDVMRGGVIPTGKVDVGRVRFLRPVGADGGSWQLDDVLVLQWLDPDEYNSKSYLRP